MKGAAKPAFVVVLGLVLYLIASNVGAGWLYVVVAALLGMVLVSIPLPWLAVRRIGVKRQTPVVATAGEPFECALELKNTGRLPRFMVETLDRFAGDAGRAVAVRLRGGRPETVRYTVENPLRGIYAGGEIVVESRAPFGLFYGRRRMRVASETVVYPRTFDVAGLPPSSERDAEPGDGSESSTLHRGHGGEFWGVREYRPGDPARLVAWKRSARGLHSGKLAVVELARETHPPFALALDLDASAPPEAREMVVSAGASLLLYALGEGREVTAEAGPDNPPFPEDATPDTVLTWCAALRPSSPPNASGTSVEIRPSTRKGENTEAGSLIVVSCQEFAGSGPWMSPEQEREFVRDAETKGRSAALLGPEVEEPWRI